MNLLHSRKYREKSCKQSSRSTFGSSGLILEADDHGAVVAGGSLIDEHGLAGHEWRAEQRRRPAFGRHETETTDEN